MSKTNALENFKKAYESLNTAQKEAVDSIEGAVMVIAGPGTGKTQILATRVASILKKTDTDPTAILALTFTDSGAVAMRQRLLSLIGVDAYKIHISTFHSFASSVIQEYPEYFIFSQTQQPLTDLKRFEIIHRILDKNKFEILKPINAPYYYVQSIISSIQDLKREGVLPDQYQVILKERIKTLEQEKDLLSKTAFNDESKNLAKNLELLSIYNLYQDSLQKEGFYDFEDMINWVVEAFQKESDLLAIYQERF